MSSSKKKYQRLEFDNQCAVILKKLISLTDLIKVQFVLPTNFGCSYLGSAFNWEPQS